MLIAGAMLLTLTTNAVEGSWQKHDTLLYGAAAVFVPLGLILNHLRLYQFSVLVVFFANSTVHFFFTLQMENAFVSAMLTLLFLSLAFVFFLSLRALVVFAVFQFLTLNAAIYLGDRTFPYSTFVAMRMTVFSIAYLFQFAISWYVEHQRRLYQHRNSELLRSLKLQNARLSKAYSDMKEFAHIVAHDLKSPLQVIGSYADLVNFELSGSSEQVKVQGHIQQILDGVQLQSRMINDVLVYSQIDGPENVVTTPVRFSDTAKLVKAQMQGLYPSGTVLIEGDGQLRAVESQFLMLLQNLIENGLKYNNSVEPCVRVIFFEQDEGNSVITIEDNGIGIPKEKLPTAFDMFVRLHPDFKAEGTGVGLAHCRKIVEEQLDGRIEIDSEVGRGTRFTIVLPADDS